MMKKFLILGLMLLIFVLFISPDFTGKMTEILKHQVGMEAPVQASCDNDCIKIASWNIQNFGAKKASNETIMTKISDVITQYDIVLIQEVSNVREKSDPGCPRNEDKCPGDEKCNLITNSLDEHINERLGLNYNFVFSPQVRDERYLIVYDNEKIQLKNAELVDDPDDSNPVCDLKQENTGLMLRQPFYGRFKSNNLEFGIMTVHTSPKINIRELEGLKVLYDDTTEEEDNVMIMGDLNADCSYLSYDEDISLKDTKYNWIIEDNIDTTVAKTDCAYDRIILRDDLLEHYTGNSGTYREITKDISDHYPIWAEFKTG